MKIVKIKPRVASMLSQIDVKVVATIAVSVCVSQALMHIGVESSSRIFNNASPSVFKVTNIEYHSDPFSPKNTSKKINGIGTGFLYHSKDYVITNAHVVADSMNVKVDDMDAEVVGVDVVRDVALLKINVVDETMQPLRRCEDPAKVGDAVLAIGNPLGFEKSLSRGIVSGIDRTLNTDKEMSAPLLHLIQTDTSINPGNSGGPLIKIKRHCVLGMNTAVVSSSGGSSGLGFAIPMDVVDQIIDNIINQREEKEEVTLGVSLLPDIYSDGLGVEGVIIAHVFPDGIGESIGLQGTYRDAHGRPNVGDILLAINGKKTEKISDVYVAMQGVEKNSILSLRILKSDGIVDIRVQT